MDLGELEGGLGPGAEVNLASGDQLSQAALGVEMPRGGLCRVWIAPAAADADSEGGSLLLDGVEVGIVTGSSGTRARCPMGGIAWGWHRRCSETRHEPVHVETGAVPLDEPARSEGVTDVLKPGAASGPTMVPRT